MSLMMSIGRCRLSCTALSDERFWQEPSAPCRRVADQMVDGGFDRGSGSPGIPRASSGGGMPGSQAAGTPGKTAAGGAGTAAMKAGAPSLHKARPHRHMSATESVACHDSQTSFGTPTEPQPLLLIQRIPAGCRNDLAYCLITFLHSN